jgi:hypothetical protein
MQLYLPRLIPGDAWGRTKIASVRGVGVPGEYLGRTKIASVVGPGESESLGYLGKTEIELRVVSGQTHKEIRSWLATQGIRVSKNALSTRCVAWSATRRSGTSVSERMLVAAVETGFHTTQHDDETIARNINAQVIPVTQSQIKRSV